MTFEDVASEVRRLGILLGDQRSPYHPSVASLELIARFEERFEFSIPADYRWFLQHGSSQRLSYLVASVRLPSHAPETGEIVAGQSSGFYDFATLDYHYSADRWIDLDGSEDAILEIDPTAERRFYEYLLPISSGHHDVLYALDFRFDAHEPPAVLLSGYGGNLSFRSDPERPADVTNFFRYVAPSFTQMLKQMASWPADEEGPSADELPYQDDTPYPWADQVLAWEAFTDAYLAEHTGPIAPREW